MSKPSLEQRIAAALTPTDITSTDLAALIAEVEGAAQAAAEDATKAREQALDPAVVVDTAKVGAAVATAELTRDRLQAALPRLRTRYTEVRKQEDIAAWKADAEKLAARRNTLVQEFAALLPVELIKQIPERLHAMREFDKEIDTLNRRRPDDRERAPARLRHTGIRARTQDSQHGEARPVPVAAANTVSLARDARRDPHGPFYHQRGGQGHLHQGA
jgi:hypothetical protein